MVRCALVLGGGGLTGIGWEWGMLAGLATGGVDLSGADLVVGVAAVSAGPPYRPVDALGVALVAASAVCLAWRQTSPIPVLAAASLLVVVSAAAGYAVTLVQWPVWIALFTCFALRGGHERLAALGVALAGVAGWAAFDRGR